MFVRRKLRLGSSFGGGGSARNVVLSAEFVEDFAGWAGVTCGDGGF